MSDWVEAHLERVTLVFRGLGAEPTPARTMAHQLLRRATQLAAAENISELEATEKLLRKVIEARSGV